MIWFSSPFPGITKRRLPCLKTSRRSSTLRAVAFILLCFIGEGIAPLKRKLFVSKKDSFLVTPTPSALNLKVSSFFTRLLSYNFVVSATVIQIQSISDLYLWEVCNQCMHGLSPLSLSILLLFFCKVYYGSGEGGECNIWLAWVLDMLNYSICSLD